MTAAARRAESLGARLPPLLAAAEQVAATVAQGVHGRRRVGMSQSFWQFRPFQQGDAVTRIDWRQSAKSDRTFIRETEWEAAQTVCLWRDDSPSMAWRSKLAPEEKGHRADLLMLALAGLLLRGGERVRALGLGLRPLVGRSGLDRLALALDRPGPRQGLPRTGGVPRHSTVVLIGDFLEPLPEIQSALAALAGIPTRGHVLHILDPAEETLPYGGRVRFRGLEAEPDALVSRVEGVRDAYAERLAAQREGLVAICKRIGWTVGTHRTDHPAGAALLGLYQALAPRQGGHAA